MFSLIVEKAAYAALEASEGEYEELEDDFLMIANEGQVALQVIEDDEDEKDKNKEDADKPFDANEADFRSRDIQILKEEDDEENEEEMALREYRESMAALLPDSGANFKAVFENQNELDAGFDAFIDEEYDEDKIDIDYVLNFGYKIGELYEEDVDAKD